LTQVSVTTSLCLNSSPAAIKARLPRVKFAGNAFAYRTPRSLNYVNGLERTVSALPLKQTDASNWLLNNSPLFLRSFSLIFARKLPVPLR
jgi:hypothetical protein